MRPDTTNWEVKHVYGQYRTAQSVAEKIRRDGGKAWAEQRPDGNYVVLVPPPEKPEKPKIYVSRWI